jgi:hypothetical protein
MDPRRRVAQNAAVSERGEDAVDGTRPEVAVHWSDDLRTCTASGLQGGTHAVSISFTSSIAVEDPIARLRLERGLLDALAAVLEA